MPNDLHCSIFDPFLAHVAEPATMDRDKRRFQPVHIANGNVEAGTERFMKDKHWQPPSTYPWRNNLTALSQRYNLYFVGYGSIIAVYRPSFPFQKLGDKPMLLIPTSLANPDALGYMDTRHQRHGINHILVGNLGSHEILLVCTDTGNVAAYYTRNVEHWVRESLKLSAEPQNGLVNIDAFFTHWVGESAWGLTIHSQARMIAVSMNEPYRVACDDPSAKVNVFAFALTPTLVEEQREVSSPGVGEDTDWQIWQFGTSKPDRNVNYKIVLQGNNGHASNIPNICFINTPQDSVGNWLLSTDIGGTMKAWNVWSGKCYRSWDFTERNYPSLLADRFGHSTRYGWNLAAIDPLAFRLSETMEEFCGWTSAPIYHGHQEGEKSYDLTNIVRNRIPGKHVIYGYAKAESASDEDPESHEWCEEEPETGPGIPIHGGQRASNSTDRISLTLPAQRPDVHMNGMDGIRSSTEPTYHAALAETTYDDSETDDDQLEDEYDDNWIGENEDDDASDPSLTSISENDAMILEESTSNDIDTNHVNEMPGSFPLPSQTTAQSLKVSKETKKMYQKAEEREVQTEMGPPPPVPILHCTAAHVRLFANVSSTSAHIFCGQMFSQETPFPLNSHFKHLERMNMIHQIPELGLVIIGTQIGRCAVCTLTRQQENGDVGLRVDWVLPFDKQEQIGQRPVMPLLGLAVGPIQGRMQSTPPRSESQSEPPASTSTLDPEMFRTSFDEEVVVLDAQRRLELLSFRSQDSPNANSPLRPRSPASPPSKRKRSPSPLVESDHDVNLIKERRSWEPNGKTESWRGRENSRRYRLMMTYLDHTVLTYEIWREASELGVATRHESARKNWRNQDPF